MSHNGITKRVTAALLIAATILAVLTACGGGADTPAADGTTAAGGAAEIAETTAEEIVYNRSNYPDSLPSDLNFNGQTITLYYRDYYIVHDYQMEGENNGGDVLYDAVYTRNTNVEDRLNVDIQFKVGPSDDVNHTKIRDEVEKLILAGDDVFDALFMSAQFGFTQSLFGYYIDLMDFPYIDYEKPWWWVDYMETESIDTNRRYMLNGDLTLFALMSATSCYFNRDEFNNVFGDEEQLYTLAEDGQWTLDAFMEYCEGSYRDVNGDGKKDVEDFYGVRHYSKFEGVNYLALSCGLEMSTRDADGLPVLDLYTPDWVTFSEKLFNYMRGEKYTFLDDKKANMPETFRTGLGMFSMGMLYHAIEYRDTDFSYGILPFPKFDESHDYISAGATPNADAIMIPVTADPGKYDAIGATLEALCADTYRNITETYYETTLKGKYLQADRDIEMVDIIYNTIDTCFIMVAGVTLGKGAISSAFYYVTYDNDGNLASYWDANSEKFQGLMDDMITQYYELG